MTVMTQLPEGDTTMDARRDTLLDVDRVGIRFDTKRRQVQAIRDVDLTVARGEFISMGGD
jgi:NitT/TauT family transport system ATP-binding protein